MDETVERRIVCAAVECDGHILVGVRHYDTLMHQQIGNHVSCAFPRAKCEQGFIDNRGYFLTREQAWPIAEAAGQIIRRGYSFDGVKLYSENIY
jgi:hypothetical protein